MLPGQKNCVDISLGNGRYSTKPAAVQSFPTIVLSSSRPLPASAGSALTDATFLSLRSWVVARWPPCSAPLGEPARAPTPVSHTEAKKRPTASPSLENAETRTTTISVQEPEESCPYSLATLQSLPWKQPRHNLHHVTPKRASP